MLINTVADTYEEENEKQKDELNKVIHDKEKIIH